MRILHGKRKGRGASIILIALQTFLNPFENIHTLSEPHITVARGPWFDIEEDESDTSAAPLSAICVPGTSQTAKNIMPRQEIIWPLNEVMKSTLLNAE